MWRKTLFLFLFPTVSHRRHYNRLPCSERAHESVVEKKAGSLVSRSIHHTYTVRNLFRTHFKPRKVLVSIQKKYFHPRIVTAEVAKLPGWWSQRYILQSYSCGSGSGWIQNFRRDPDQNPKKNRFGSEFGQLQIRNEWQANKIYTSTKCTIKKHIFQKKFPLKILTLKKLCLHSTKAKISSEFAAFIPTWRIRIRIRNNLKSGNPDPKNHFWSTKLTCVKFLYSVLLVCVWTLSYSRFGY